MGIKLKPPVSGAFLLCSAGHTLNSRGSQRPKYFSTLRDAVNLAPSKFLGTRDLMEEISRRAFTGGLSAVAAAAAMPARASLPTTPATDARIAIIDVSKNPLQWADRLHEKKIKVIARYFARQALRHLDELRVEHGRLDFPVPVGAGGTLRVELNNTNPDALPSGMRLGDNDSRILAVAMNLASDEIGRAHV